jgi:hypothetical protein
MFLQEIDMAVERDAALSREPKRVTEGGSEPLLAPVLPL